MPTGNPSYTIESLGYVWNGTAWVPATQPGGGGSGGDASAANQVTGNASLASIDTKLTAPLTVAGPITDAQLRASAVPVSLASVPSHPVTGPLTDTQLRAAAVPVSGAFFQATQPVSGTVGVNNFPATQPVSGTVSVGNFPATQPVSAAALPLPAGAATETTLGAVSGKLPATLGQKTMAASLPIVLASDHGPISIQHALTGATIVMKTGTITTVAVTADQVVLTYTVTAAKTFYLQYLVMYGRLTTLSATASILGAISLESPAGTKLITFDDVNCTTSEIGFQPLVFNEPIPIAAGVVVRIVVTPAAATSMLWRANMGGYER